MVQILQVTNVPPSVTIDQMRTLFGHIGPIEQIVLYPEDDLPDSSTKVCYLRYTEEESSGVSLHLNNTVFLDRALIVLPLPPAQDTMPEETYANLVRAPAHTAAGVPPRSAEWPSDVISMVVGKPGEQVIMTLEPRLSSLGLPPYPPLPATTDSSKIEEIRRTIYVTNLDIDTTAEQVVEFFGNHSEVRFIRMAGTDLERAAFVEFTSQTGVPIAFQLIGATFNGQPIMIQHASNAITKPTSYLGSTSFDDVAKRVKEAESLISGSAEKMLTTKSRSRSPSRRKTRSPSRSRRRSRSRSHKSHRSSHRRRSPSPKSRKKRSRSRSKDRKGDVSRSRGRRHITRRSKSRHRSRSKGRRKSRSRSHGRRDRDRRDKDRHDRDKDRRDRDKDRRDRDKRSDRDKDSTRRRDDRKEREDKEGGSRRDRKSRDEKEEKHTSSRHGGRDARRRSKDRESDHDRREEEEVASKLENSREEEEEASTHGNDANESNITEVKMEDVEHEEEETEATKNVKADSDSNDAANESSIPEVKMEDVVHEEDETEASKNAEIESSSNHANESSIPEVKMEDVQEYRENEVAKADDACSNDESRRNNCSRNESTVSQQGSPNESEMMDLDSIDDEGQLSTAAADNVEQSSNSGDEVEQPVVSLIKPNCSSFITNEESGESLQENQVENLTTISHQEIREESPPLIKEKIDDSSLPSDDENDSQFSHPEAEMNGSTHPKERDDLNPTPEETEIERSVSENGNGTENGSASPPTTAESLDEFDPPLVAPTLPKSAGKRSRVAAQLDTPDPNTAEETMDDPDTTVRRSTRARRSTQK